MDATSARYSDHPVFAALDECTQFYERISRSVMRWLVMGTRAAINPNSYVFSSIQGTLNSVKEVLIYGRIGDGYSLLRKYHDILIINVYWNLFIEDKLAGNLFIVSEFDEWVRGNRPLPEYRILSQYVNTSPRLTELNDLLQKDSRYRHIRKKCNDQIHVNDFGYLLLNDGEIRHVDRVKWLDEFLDDLLNLFVMHFSYIFWISDNYMMASDYVDALDAGVNPEEGSEDWVAPFVQEMLDKTWKPRRPDIYAALKQASSMRLA